jgi:Cu/Zn superoxide dismutase
MFKLGRKKTEVLVAMFVLGWSASSAANDAPSLKTKMINAKGQQVGEATLTETPTGLLVRLNLSAKRAGIDPGTRELEDFFLTGFAG